MKILFTLLLIVSAFLANAQTKKVAPDVRNDPTDSTYGLHYDTLVYGGLHVFKNLMNRNNIPFAMRKIGMLAVGQDSAYQLRGGIANSNWQRVYWDSVSINNIINVVNNNNNISCKNELIDGSVLVDTGFTGHTTDLYYRINCKYYNIAAIPSFPITPAHATDARYTIGVVDTLGNFGTIDCPYANPVPICGVDESSQLIVAIWYIPGGSTTPQNITDITIYKEAVEWDFLRGTVSSSPDSAYLTNPFEGARSTLIPQVINGEYFEFLYGSLVNRSDWMNLNYQLRLAAPFEDTKILMSFYLDNSLITSNTVQLTSGNYGYNKDIINTYQFISTPLSEWNFFSGTFNKVRFSFIGNNASGFQIDNVILHKENNGVTKGYVESVNSLTGPHVNLFIGDTLYANADTSMYVLKDLRTNTILAVTPTYLKYLRSIDTCLVIDSIDSRNFTIATNINCRGYNSVTQAPDSSYYDIHQPNGIFDRIQVTTGGTGGGFGVTVTSYGKNAGGDSTILLLSDGTRYAALDSIGSGGTTQRFGIEDITGIQNRAIDMQNFNLDIANVNSFKVYNNSSEITINDAGLGAKYINMFAGDANLDVYGAMFMGVNEITNILRNDLTGYRVSTTLAGTGRSFSIGLQQGVTGLTLSSPVIDSVQGAYIIPITVNGNSADSSGNITIAAGGSESTTASNGLTLTGVDVALGGVLTGNTTIWASGNKSLFVKLGTDTTNNFFQFSGGTSSQYIQSVFRNSTNGGISYFSTQPTTGYFDVRTATNYSAYVRARNDGASGDSAYVYMGANTPSGIVSTLMVQPRRIDLNTDTLVDIITQQISNTLNGEVKTVLKIRRGSGVALDGTGLSIDLHNSTSAIATAISNQIISKWTESDAISSTSEFSITGVDNATINTLLQISGAGIFILTQGLTEYADDAAAASGGIPINGLYKTGSVVKIRVS